MTFPYPQAHTHAQDEAGVVTSWQSFVTAVTGLGKRVVKLLFHFELTAEQCVHFLGQNPRIFLFLACCSILAIL